MWVTKKYSKKLSKRVITYLMYVKDGEALCWVKPGRSHNYRANIKGSDELIFDNDLDIIKFKCAIILKDMALLKG